MGYKIQGVRQSFWDGGNTVEGLSFQQKLACIVPRVAPPLAETPFEFHAEFTFHIMIHGRKQSCPIAWELCKSQDDRMNEWSIIKFEQLE